MIIKEHVNLKPRNTFGIEARCRYWIECDDEGQLLDLLASRPWRGQETFVLGGGSNVLFTADFPGVIFHPAMKEREIASETATEVFLRVGAGVPWDDVVRWAVERGYGGIENLSMVPGSVGATPVQNIGAYGAEIGERIARVEAIDVERGVKRVISGEECRFGYRDSLFKGEWKDRFIITRVTYRLSKTPRFHLDYRGVREEVERTGEPSLASIRQAIIRLREARLPDVKALPNAGSFFKNPVVERSIAERLSALFPAMPSYPAGEGNVKLAAGWLIEQAGWKGRAIGEAAVHDKQALVLVNKGGATGSEIARLANEIKKSVFMNFGVWIEPEVNIL
ncbi:MAG: UDP-N-acetylmuramate dehydrogenase [Odoribacteraceae bacterium]|jgi:UDP-N-acetylmuramate dehydrogenase|nr:UDP-N-acetylmuramate dehydrogenase [Odoribacteraceae bacterium]